MEDKSVDKTGERQINRNYIVDSLLDFTKNILKFWWLFLIIGLLAGLAGAYYVSKTKPVYKSKLTFALDDGDGNGVGSFLSLASQFGINVGGGKDIFAGDNIIDILRSRRMIERVLLSIDTFNNRPYTLIEYYLLLTQGKKGKIKGNKPEIHFPVGQSNLPLTYQQDSVLYQIYKVFIANVVQAQRPDRKLSIYEVNVTSPDEKFSKVNYKFVATHPDSYVSAFQLALYETRWPLDSVRQLYNQFNPKIQKSFYGKEVAESVNDVDSNSPGRIAKSFTAKDIIGNSINLSDFKCK